MRPVFLFSCLLLLAVGPASAVSYLVTPSGGGDFATIQAAIDAAADGDSVVLASGIFVGPGNREIDYWGKSITVVSQSGDPSDCIVDCQGVGRGVFFHSGESALAVLEAVTITNGLANGGDNLTRSGGGIQCRENSSPTITQCVLTNNEAVYAGGGIALAHSASPAITDCVFSNNVAEYGGGVFAIDQCVPVFVNCLFVENAVIRNGGGLYCYNSVLSLVGCTLSRNSAYLGSAADCHEGGVVDLDGCTVTGNSSGFGGVFRCFNASIDLANTIVAFSAQGEAVLCLGTGSVQLSCCDVFGNEGGDYIGCISDQLNTNGNVSEDPIFCSSTPDVSMDWTIRSDSPCLPESSGCGLIGAWGTGCHASPTERKTWGAIKMMYGE